MVGRGFLVIDEHAFCFLSDATRAFLFTIAIGFRGSANIELDMSLE